MPDTIAIAPYATAATSKGVVDGSVSRQWASRPAEQRFTTLGALAEFVTSTAETSTATVIDPRAITVQPTAENDLTLLLPNGEVVDMNNWSFGQTAALAGAPSRYLAKLPAKLAAANLQFGLKTREAGDVMPYVQNTGDGLRLRAMTSPKYGRITDAEVVAKISDFVEADPRWKVPGMLEWASANGLTVKHNPNVEVTTQNTTLYASDRDVWVFLCQDANPIEIGKLEDGSPDYVFRGVIISNSEVGAQTFNMRTMLLRGVCFNRNLWGVQDVNELTIRHTAGAPERFLAEAVPALTSYAEGATAPIVAKIAAARQISIGDDEDDRIDWLTRRLDVGLKVARELLVIHEAEEGRPLLSAWDAVQAATAYARRIEFTDARIGLEEAAGAIMDKVKA